VVNRLRATDVTIYSIILHQTQKCSFYVIFTIAFSLLTSRCEN